MKEIYLVIKESNNGEPHNNHDVVAAFTNIESAKLFINIKKSQIAREKESNFPTCPETIRYYIQNTNLLEY